MLAQVDRKQGAVGTQKNPLAVFHKIAVHANEQSVPCKGRGGQRWVASVGGIIVGQRRRARSIGRRRLAAAAVGLTAPREHTKGPERRRFRRERTPEPRGYLYPPGGRRSRQDPGPGHRRGRPRPSGLGRGGFNVPRGRPIYLGGRGPRRSTAPGARAGHVLLIWVGDLPTICLTCTKPKAESRLKGFKAESTSPGFG